MSHSKMMTQRFSDLLRIFRDQEWEAPSFTGGVFTFVLVGDYGVRKNVTISTGDLRDELSSIVEKAQWSSDDLPLVTEELREIIRASNAAQFDGVGDVLSRRTVQRERLGWMEDGSYTAHQAKVRLTLGRWVGEDFVEAGNVVWIDCAADEECF